MADSFKVLGQEAPGATTEEDLYTVPDAAQAVSSSLIVCNRSGSTPTYRVSVSVGGSATANTDYLFYDKALTANGTDKHVIGITLDETDVVRVYASTADVTFTLFGNEFTFS